MKIQLALVGIVAIAAIYSYFAYSRDMFPFTKANKRKLNKLLGKKEPLDDSALGLLDEFGNPMEGEGLVDDFGSIENPRGGTGARGISSTGSLGDPAIKGDLNLANLYQQELYRQLFLPFEDNPQEGDAIPRDTIVRGGDIPAYNDDVPMPYKYPFPVDERLNDMYGLFPPGGSYGGRDPYSPINGGSIGGGRKPFNRALLDCHDCPEGQSWDNCRCRCGPVDEPRLMCYRPECECPGGGLGDNPDRGGHGGHGDGRGTHGNGGEPNCPSGYVFDSCRCKCVSPNTPAINCIRNCTQCGQGQWYSFCTGQCVSGKQRQCEPEIEFMDIPDIPEWLPDSAAAEIGDLRDVRDRLLQEIEMLREDLQDQIDQLHDKLEEEREKRRDLEDLVEEIQDDMAEEQNDPPEDRQHHNEQHQHDLVDAQAIIQRVQDEIERIRAQVSVTHGRVTATVAEVNNVDNRISAKAGGTKATASSSGAKVTAGGNTSATAGGGGKAVACAGGHCISANQAARVGSLTRSERQYAFSKLQNKARRMNTLKEKPTAFLKNKQFLNVLPPIVAKRHMASRITLS